MNIFIPNLIHEFVIISLLFLLKVKEILLAFCAKHAKNEKIILALVIIAIWLCYSKFDVWPLLLIYYNATISTVGI